MIYPLGATSQSIDVQIVDDSGLPVTGLLAATFPALTYSLAGPNVDAGFPALSDLATLTTAWAAGGVKERGGGVYRLDLPNGIFASAGEVKIRGEASGKHVLAPWIDVDPLSAALLDEANGVETGVTLRQAIRGIMAALFGKLITSGQNPEVYQNPAGTANRLSVANDSAGNRTAVTLTL